MTGAEAMRLAVRLLYRTNREPFGGRAPGTVLITGSWATRLPPTGEDAIVGFQCVHHPAGFGPHLYPPDDFPPPAEDLAYRFPAEEADESVHAQGVTDAT